MVKEKRSGKRELTSLTKEILLGLTEGTLDNITAKTFGWMRKRETHAEEF